VFKVYSSLYLVIAAIIILNNIENEGETRRKRSSFELSELSSAIGQIGHSLIPMGLAVMKNHD
jgi:hypothetical protein